MQKKQNIKIGYYLKLLIHETIKLPGGTENKITKDYNDENMPHLEVIELVLVYCKNVIQVRLTDQNS